MFHEGAGQGWPHPVLVPLDVGEALGGEMRGQPVEPVAGPLTAFGDVARHLPVRGPFGLDFGLGDGRVRGQGVRVAARALGVDVFVPLHVATGFEEFDHVDQGRGGIAIEAKCGCGQS